MSKDTTEIQPDPATMFPDFYDNAAIENLAGTSRWSVSDSEKAPIDMRGLIDLGRIRGAYSISRECLVTLDELTTILPNAANNAFYLKTQLDGYMVLDIEKTCPPEIAAELLKLPSVYAEKSMSGLGYHLVMPIPTNYWDFPVAANKKVLKHPNKWYEVLLDHWVTFTRNIVPMAEHGDAPDDAWSKLYASLAETAEEAPMVEFDMQLDKPEIVKEDTIIELLTRRPIAKKLEDFHGDNSSYEFSILGILYNKLKTILVAIRDAEPDAVYDDGIQAWLIYQAIEQIVDHRDKHDEQRNGMPLLLNAAVSLVALRVGEENAKGTA